MPEPSELTSLNELMDLTTAFKKSCVILSAIELDICAVLGNRRLQSDELAKEINADPRGTDRLLRALCAMGLLESTGGVFANTAFSSRYLDSTSEEYAARLHHQIRQYKSWGTLTECVRKGGSVTVKNIAEQDSEFFESFLASMDHRAKEEAAILAPRLNLSETHTILDVGGGSGAFAIAFAKVRPDIRAVVFDLPQVTPITQRYIEAAGMEKQVTTHSGNFLTDDLGEGFDMIFFSEIVHMHSFNENKALMRRVGKALNPGGWILLMDHFLNEDRLTPAPNTLFALNMLVSTPKGDAYTECEAIAWLEEAGCTVFERFEGPRKADIIAGRKTLSNETAPAPQKGCKL